MRNFIIILVVVAVIGVFVYVYGKKAVDNFDFGTPKFVGADLTAIFQGTGFTTIDLTSTITNKNNFSIPVNNLYIEVYYLGQLVGKSTTPHDKFAIPANGSIVVSQNMTLAVSNSIQIAGKLIAGEQIDFTYMVKAKIFGLIPIRYKGKFTY